MKINDRKQKLHNILTLAVKIRNYPNLEYYYTKRRMGIVIKVRYYRGKNFMTFFLYFLLICRFITPKVFRFLGRYSKFWKVIISYFKTNLKIMSQNLKVKEIFNKIYREKIVLLGCKCFLDYKLWIFVI